MAKSDRPRRGRRAFRDKNAGLAGVGGGAIAGEATGAAVLPGRGPTRPLGRRRHGICGVAATSSSGRGRGSAWATGLCWHEVKSLAGTRPRALLEGVCRAIGNECERPWRQGEKARPDEGVAAETRQPTRARQDTAANLPGRVVALPEQRRERRLTRVHGLDYNKVTLKIDLLCKRRLLHPI